MVALRVPRDVRGKKVIDACSFCGRDERTAGRLVAGRSGLICRHCAAEVHQVFHPSS